MIGDYDVDGRTGQKAKFIDNNGTNMLINSEWGMTLFVKGSAIADSDFNRAPPDGAMGLDNVADALYVRSGGAWVSTALT